MYRAFFSVPATVTGQDGRPVNAVFGYLDMTARLIADRAPQDVVHVYDHDWRPASRVAVYSGYKANRPPDPEGLPEQFLLLRELLDAIGMSQAEAPDWEAEDAIGAICAEAIRAAGGGPRPDMREPGIDVVTGDRDLIQLVRDPMVRVLFTVRGVTDLRVLDEAGVVERFGVPASRYAEFAILRGDPSDGLPGVRGVGEKTARDLIGAYESLDEILEDAKRAAPDRRPLKGSAAMRARLREAAPYLAAMREIVPIRLDVPVRSWRMTPDPERVEELAAVHRVTGPVSRLRHAVES
jgi:5'-3' exonuclease